MLQENTLSIIDKLVNSKVTINELQQIAPLLSDSDFKDTFQLVEDLESAIKPIGRSKLRKEIIAASSEYHKEMRVVELKNASKWKLSAIAACFVAMVGIAAYFVVGNYSNKDTYSSRSGGGTFIKDLNPEIK
jgi:hypothetical protein